jgi:lipoprotein-releasing system permease protein
MVLGKFELKESDKIQSIVLGLTLSDRLGAIVGDEVTIVSPYTFGTGLSPFAQPLTMRFKVEGIYESNNKEYDAQYAFISLPAAQQLFEMQNKFTGVEARLTDINQSDNLKSELSAKLPAAVDISTWYDLHADLYSMMKIERWIAYILLCLIILVASFNMLGSLTMTVIEKRRDIGILQSMGANRKSIIKIFMFEGLLIGMIGNVLGIGIGLLLIYLQQKYFLFPLDPTVYIIPAIPVEIHASDFILVTVASILLTAVAA